MQTHARMHSRGSCEQRLIYGCRSSPRFLELWGLHILVSRLAAPLSPVKEGGNEESSKTPVLHIYRAENRSVFKAPDQAD